MLWNYPGFLAGTFVPLNSAHGSVGVRDSLTYDMKMNV